MISSLKNKVSGVGFQVSVTGLKKVSRVRKNQVSEVRGQTTDGKSGKMKHAI
jgi:hypothetical protein